MLIMANEFQCPHCNKKAYKTEKNLTSHVNTKHPNTRKDVLPMSDDQKNSSDLDITGDITLKLAEEGELHTSPILMDRKKVIGAKCHSCNIVLDAKHIFGEPQLLDKDNRIFRVEFQCPGDSYIIIRIQKES